MASLSLKHIYKIYPNGFEAVKDFNLEVEDKEFIIFVGPSGCGKSTTLRMIAGLEDISDGEFLIDGKIMNDVEPKDRDIAMVFQNYALYPHMTVEENMAFGLKLRKTPKHEINKKVKDASVILDLAGLLERKPAALSGGQRQRVAMGRAIVREPKVFLMDEPLSNLDAKLRVQMRAEIAALHQRLGATIIYVTHDQTEAMTLGTRIVVMKDGIVQQVASPRELYNNPVNLFVAGFIGSPQMNFVNAWCREENGDIYLDFDRFTIKVLGAKAAALRDKEYIGKQVIMGIRPERIFESQLELSVHQDTQIEVKINGYELLGSEVLLYFDLLNEKPEELQRQFSDDAYANAKKVHWTAKVDAATTARYGSTITLALDPNKLHFFDKDTEQAIVN
ncbi:MAG: sn-glycerol-3-phosphate ABC transporter ATP-binding protein UgpC [Oscillospiraceae bacterium]|nr:sn-glycerol-3-phosphate ABC transporter ATP-binding protein UgpC [Oscillospiraceae bacterium]